MRHSILILAFVLSAGALPAAPPSAETVLERTVAYHDPDGAWSTRPIEIVADVIYGKGLAEKRGYDRRTDRILIDNAGERFEYRSNRAGDRVEVIGKGDAFTARLNGSAQLGAEEREKYRLKPDQLFTWRDYFTYMFGPPMKLRDPGTSLDDEVRVTTFADREVYALRVTYAPEVGRDIWYFYVDPGNWALVGCRFYHDESKNDGEYLVFEGEVEGPHGLRLPQQRHWYVNADDEFLATDKIKSIR